ncbi:MAG: DUF2520 domain-containing protein [Actinomycetota bacterium]
MDIAIVGAGKAGTALAVLWAEVGHRIVAVSGRRDTRERVEKYLPETPVLAAPDAARKAEVVVIGVPDDAILAVCIGLSERQSFHSDQWVVHLSGGSSLRLLESAKNRGARILSLHPLQTFPDVDSAIERIPGSAVAVTAERESGYMLGEQLAKHARGNPFRLPDEQKAIYHAAAVFASNYIVASTAQAEALMESIDLPDPRELFMPLSRASLENVALKGSENAITGPASRGDAGTVETHLRALADAAPEAVQPYAALARVAMDLAEKSGKLTPEQRSAVEKVLTEWK